MNEEERDILEELEYSLRERADYNCAFEEEKDDIEQLYAPSREMVEQIGSIIGHLMHGNG